MREVKFAEQLRRERKERMRSKPKLDRQRETMEHIADLSCTVGGASFPGSSS